MVFSIQILNTLHICISFNYFHHSFFWSFSSNALAPKLCSKSSILWKVHQFRNRCMRANVFKRFLIKSGILQPLPAKFVFKRNFKFENAGFFHTTFSEKTFPKNLGKNWKFKYVSIHWMLSHKFMKIGFDV